MSEPVIRSTFPAAHPDAPQGAGFSNSFGVMRVQHGSAEDAQAAVRLAAQHREEERAKPQWSATVGTGNTLMRSVSIGGEQTTESVGLVQGNTADLRSASGDAPVFHSSGGRTLIGSEILPTSLVTLPGIGTTSVRAAVISGFLRQNASTGLYESTSGAPAAAHSAPLTPQQARAAQLVEDQATLQRLVDEERQAKEEATKDTVTESEPLAAEAQAIIDEAIPLIGAIDGAHLVAQLVDRGEISDDFANTLATSLNTDPETVRARLGTVMASLEVQARAAIGGAHADDVVAWAREVKPQELRAAMNDHGHTGSTAKYTELRQAFMEQLGDTQEGRNSILASPDAAAWGFVEHRGKVYINGPNGTRVEWRVAVRQGLIAPGKGQ